MNVHSYATRIDAIDRANGVTTRRPNQSAVVADMRRGARATGDPAVVDMAETAIERVFGVGPGRDCDPED